jgi:hypothetical protein
MAGCARLSGGPAVRRAAGRSQFFPESYHDRSRRLERHALIAGAFLQTCGGPDQGADNVRVLKRLGEEAFTLRGTAGRGVAPEESGFLVRSRIVPLHVSAFGGPAFLV